MSRIKNKSFHWQSFTSFFITLAGIIILITGIILYLAPAGRVAYWSNWKLFSLTKTEWQNIHTIFSFLFAIFAGIHLFFNWKVFIFYIHNKVKKSFNKTFELLISLLAVLIIFMMTMNELPPFQTVMDFGVYLTDSWSNEETEPPVPHAELMTLSEFSKVMSISLADLKNNMDKVSIYVPDSTMDIKQISEYNEISPNELFKKVQVYFPELEKKSTESTEPAIGSGYGRKTLNQICKDLNITLTEAQDSFHMLNINASAEDKLKDIADAHEEFTPLDLYNILKKIKQN